MLKTKPEKENTSSNTKDKGTPQFAKRSVTALAISGSKLKMVIKPEQILTFRKMEPDSQEQ